MSKKLERVFKPHSKCRFIRIARNARETTLQAWLLLQLVVPIHNIILIKVIIVFGKIIFHKQLWLRILYNRVPGVDFVKTLHVTQVVWALDLAGGARLTETLMIWVISFKFFLASNAFNLSLNIVHIDISFFILWIFLADYTLIVVDLEVMYGVWGPVILALILIFAFRLIHYIIYLYIVYVQAIWIRNLVTIYSLCYGGILVVMGFIEKHFVRCRIMVFLFFFLLGRGGGVKFFV